jgi:hypothetical protein
VGVSTNRPAGQRRQPARGPRRAQGRQPSRGLRSASGRQPSRSGQAPPGRTLFTPGASRARQSVEQRSAAPLLFLRQLPPWLLPLILVVLLIAGLAWHGVVSAIALCGVAVVLGWLALLSWPRLSPAGRLGRTLVITLVLVVAVIQAVR